MSQQPHKNVNGILEIICGPMFSGKSEELIRRLRRAKIAKLDVVAFKPSIDDRHAIEYVVSHNGSKFHAHPLDTLEQMLDIAGAPEVDVIGIDEVQFFPKDIVPVILELVDAGKRVLIAGLDLDFRGVPFGSMPALLALADKITKLQAICTQCGTDAHFSQRLINDEPAKYDDPIVLVGAQEAYQARCRSCFVIDKQPTI